MADAVSSSHHSTADSRKSPCMSEEEQDERRRQIRDIMKDPNLSQLEKSRTIQSLMDGRRRGSGGARSVCSNESRTPSAYVNSMAEAAAAAADYYSSDEEGDAIMSSDRPDNVCYGCSYEDRSVSSEITHSSHVSMPHNLPPGMTYRQIHGRSFSLQDWNDNDRVAAAAHTSILHNPAQVSRLMEQSRPPCQHYERNCTIVSPCCGLAFGCRICHEDCPVLPPPFRRRSGDQLLGSIRNKTAPKPLERRRSMPVGFDYDEEGNHHPIDRFAIREVICRECYTRQSSKTNNCITCGVRFGAYHCNICNLWMSSSESPYHCPDCGFCRVGGRENFRHCHDCGMCIDATLFDEHNCKSGKYMSNCPICQEDLFSSRHASHEMPCGHAIHWHCFEELTSYDTRCPVCKKTAEPPEQMASTWSAIAMGIALQPVPEDMARVVNILCNDCEERGSNRRWHFLGVRCNNCLSFNTSVAQIVMHGRDAAAYLEQLEASQATAAGIPANVVTSMSGVTVEDAMVPGLHETSSGSSSGMNHFSTF